MCYIEHYHTNLMLQFNKECKLNFLTLIYQLIGLTRSVLSVKLVVCCSDGSRPAIEEPDPPKDMSLVISNMN